MASIDRLRRVLWRLQELKVEIIPQAEIRRAIMLECGSWDKTIRTNIRILKELGWIKRVQYRLWKLTGKEYEDL